MDHRTEWDTRVVQFGLRFTVDRPDRHAIPSGSAPPSTENIHSVCMFLDIGAQGRLEGPQSTPISTPISTLTLTLTKRRCGDGSRACESAGPGSDPRVGPPVPPPVACTYILY